MGKRRTRERNCGRSQDQQDLVILWKNLVPGSPPLTPLKLGFSLLDFIWNVYSYQQTKPPQTRTNDHCLFCYLLLILVASPVLCHWKFWVSRGDVWDGILLLLRPLPECFNIQTLSVLFLEFYLFNKSANKYGYFSLFLSAALIHNAWRLTHPETPDMILEVLLVCLGCIGVAFIVVQKKLKKKYKTTIKVDNVGSGFWVVVLGLYG